jgi:hypothetical protein
MKRVQFSVTYPDRFVHPLQGQVAGAAPITRAELLMWSPTAEATALVWCDGDRPATEAAVSATDSLLEHALVEGSGGTYAFLRQERYEFAPALLDLVAESRVIFLPPIVFRETGDVRFEAVGARESLGAFYEALAELGDVTVEEVHEFERRTAPSRLTERQRAALETGVSVGYYEIPREGNVTDVADALDCSRSTAGELLRKAEAAVIRAYTEADRP